jgi:hypothetical protein
VTAGTWTDREQGSDPLQQSRESVADSPKAAQSAPGLVVLKLTKLARLPFSLRSLVTGLSSGYAIRPDWNFRAVGEPNEPGPGGGVAPARYGSIGSAAGSWRTVASLG